MFRPSSPAFQTITFDIPKLRAKIANSQSQDWELSRAGSARCVEIIKAFVGKAPDNTWDGKMHWCSGDVCDPRARHESLILITCNKEGTNAPPLSEDVRMALNALDASNWVVNHEVTDDAERYTLMAPPFLKAHKDPLEKEIARVGSSRYAPINVYI